MNILSIDPSGNFTEGKGTTGWALLDTSCAVIACGQIKAELFENKIAYWKGVISLIDKLKPNYLVIEDFLLYEKSKNFQINSRFETVKLIGIIEYIHQETPIILQRAVEVKKRWSDEILTKKQIIIKSNNHYFSSGILLTKHMRDAIRHGVHFITFKLAKEIKNATTL